MQAYTYGRKQAPTPPSSCPTAQNSLLDDVKRGVGLGQNAVEVVLLAPRPGDVPAPPRLHHVTLAPVDELGGDGHLSCACVWGVWGGCGYEGCLCGGVRR